jgi:hypothetical protein
MSVIMVLRRQAITAAPVKGVVFVPPGNCVVTDTLAISSAHPVSIIGSGVGSQIFQRSDNTLLQLTGVNALMVKDLFLGSAAISSGTSLIELTNSHHNRIDNVTMLGGKYGLHLFGSLLNTVVDLRGGTNFANLFFANSAASQNQYWVFAERDSVHQIPSNANTFLSPSLEGGTNGIAIQDLPDPSCNGCVRDGQGSLQILGGTIEGVPGTALTLDRTFLPSSISGVHFEANGLDVLINQAANIRLTAVLSLGGCRSTGKLPAIFRSAIASCRR